MKHRFTVASTTRSHHSFSYLLLCVAEGWIATETTSFTACQSFFGALGNVTAQLEMHHLRALHRRASAQHDLELSKK